MSGNETAPDDGLEEEAHDRSDAKEEQNHVDPSDLSEGHSEKSVELEELPEEAVLPTAEPEVQQQPASPVPCPGVPHRPCRWPHRDRWTGMPKTMLEKFRKEQQQQILELQEREKLDRMKSRQEDLDILDRDKMMVEEDKKNIADKRQSLQKIDVANKELAEKQKEQERAAKARIFAKDAISVDFFNQFNYEQGAWADEQDCGSDDP